MLPFKQNNLDMVDTIKLGKGLSLITGVMSSGKSATFITLAETLEDVKVCTFHLEDRFGDSKIGSRTLGKSLSVDFHFDPQFSFINYFKHNRPCNILVDEAQFLTEEQAYELQYMVYVLHYNIFAFGILTDATSKLWPSISVLLSFASYHYRFSNICDVCGEETNLIYNVLVSDCESYYIIMQPKIGKECIKLGGFDKLCITCYNHYCIPKRGEGGLVRGIEDSVVDCELERRGDG